MGEKELAYRTLSGILMPPMSNIYGQNINISRFLNNIISFYFPNAKKIYDPTCGEENFQFKDYLVKRNGKWYYRLENGDLAEYVASDIKKTRWNCSNSECLIVDVLRPPYPFRDNEFDIVVYDPPFLPSKRNDNRGKAYGIDEERTLYSIKQYYSKKVFREFHRITKYGMLVKGEDFYYSTTSDNLYIFLYDILDIDIIRKYFKIVAVHIYRFFNRSIPINRARLGLSQQSKGYRRPIICHSYYIILYKIAI